VRAARQAAEQRAKAEQERAIQEQLRVETQQRRRGSGMSSLIAPYRVGTPTRPLGSG
jgi:hypothetical protein